LETFVQKFTNLRFDPAGLTDDPDVRMAQSIMDYIFRRLALDYLPFETRAGLGIYSAEERQRELETGSYAEGAVDAEAEPSEAEALKRSEPSPAVTEVADAATVKPAPVEAHTTAEMLEAITGAHIDAPLCFTCGTKMRPAGSCFVCEGCGATSGCS
jgi:ribonucleoside-diphosphate reductase alpha chain